MTIRGWSGPTTRWATLDSRRGICRSATRSRPSRVKGNRISETLTIGNGTGATSGTVVAVHDGVGNPVTLTYPGGREIETAYDPLDRIGVITEAEDPLADFKYVGPGRVKQRDLANDTRATFFHDAVGRVTEVRHAQLPGGSAFRRYVSQWDAMSNRTVRQDWRMGGLRYDYTYDSLYRLVHSRRMRAGGGEPTTTVEYDLDPVGNRTTITGPAGTGDYLLDPRTPEPADQQVNQYTRTPADWREYDANGNPLTRDAASPLCDASASVACQGQSRPHRPAEPAPQDDLRRRHRARGARMRRLYVSTILTRCEDAGAQKRGRRRVAAGPSHVAAISSLR